MIELKVNPNDNLSFHTISDALIKANEYAEGIVKISISDGRYYEKVTIDRPFTILEGESENTILEFDDYALKMHEDGRKYGTFRSYTLFIDTHDVTIKNMTVRNMCSSHKKAGQALALYADGDHLYFENVKLKSYQDTLFTGPLPPFPYSIGGFTGPKEFCERINGHQYYKNCYICGDIDFIFGSGTAYFEDCLIESVTDPDSLNDYISKGTPLGYITAASTPEGQEYGYVFNNCSLISTCPDKSIYLGRPWRDFAKTVFINCNMDSHINPEGFHDWNKENARNTIFYAEYNNSGEGAEGTRAPFVKKLSNKEIAHYSKESVLGSLSEWALLI